MLKFWKNRGTFAGQRGTIGWFKSGLSLEKKCGTFAWQRGTFKGIRYSTI